MNYASTAFLWRRFALNWIVLALTTSAQASSLPSFREAVGDVIPAVVHISSSERVLQTSDYLGPYEYFFKTPVPQGSKTFPLASGFLINPRGTCITSFRAIEGATRFELTTADKRRLKATLVGGDRTLDLAVLKVSSGESLPQLELGDSERLVLGDRLALIGQPLGFGPLLTETLLASKGNLLGAGPLNRFLVLSAPTHPGNVGGPLIDGRGRVVGLALVAPSGPSSLGFALPSKLIGPAVRDLLRHGKIQRPWLGLVARSLPNLDSLTEVYGTGPRAGLIVDNLIVDGPAAKAGLQVGDLILGLGSRELEDVLTLQDALASRKAGDTLQLKIFRRKQGHLDISLKLGEIPSAEDLPSHQDLM